MATKKSVPAIQERKEGKPMAANETKFSKIVITDKDGQKFTLEFNSRVVKSMERRGFQINMDFPYTVVDDLFLGAFQMHHKYITPDRAKEIWAAQTKKDELLAALVKIYMLPFEDLMKDPDGKDEAADPTWETA